MKKIFFLMMISMIAILTGCGKEDSLIDMKIKVAVLGEAPKQEFENVKFKETTFKEYTKDYEDYDALLVNKKHHSQYLNPKNKEFFYQTNTPVYFLGLKTLLSGVSAAYAVFEDGYEFDTLLFSQESKMQAQGYYNKNGMQHAHFLLMGHENSTEVYHEIIKQIRMVKKNK